MIQSVVGKFVEKGRWIREEEREREFSSRKREIFTTLSNRSKGENIGGKSFFFQLANSGDFDESICRHGYRV